MTFDPESWPGSSGSGVGPSCLLTLSAVVDIHLVGTHSCLWDQIRDNAYDFNLLGSLPTGLGLTTPADGSTALLTTTAAGVWAFTFEGGGNAAADANIRATLTEGFAGNSQPFGPTFASTPFATLAVVYALPSGAQGGFSVTTRVAAAAGSYTCAPILAISRLA